MVEGTEIRRKAVFLDRDGVLNRSEVRDGKPYAPRDLKSFELLHGTHEAIHILHEAGLALVVVTNQPDVAKGLIHMATVEAMHDLIRKELPIDLIKVCYHDQKDSCLCRKPRPGMLIEASSELGIDLAKSFMIGDRWSDVDAGRSLGCYTIFIDRGYSESLNELPDATVNSLTEAADLILKRLNK